MPKKIVNLFPIIAGAALVVLAVILVVTSKQSQAPTANVPANGNANAPLLGGDRDAHGCIGSVGYSWCQMKQKCLRPWEEGCDIKAVFDCAANKSIQADFEQLPADQVVLELSDGRTATLPHAISADGARYANPDESFVFWNKGDGATITENGKETYSGCVARK